LAVNDLRESYQSLGGAIMMKKILIGSIAAATMTASAYAADLPARMAPPPPPPIPLCIWCGAYVGVNGGGGWITRSGFGNNNNQDVFVETVGVGGAVFPVSAGTINQVNSRGGPFGGGQIGINWQWGMFVAGAELDFQGSRINSNGAGSGVNIFGGLTTVATAERLDYFGTARGRVGLAFGGPNFGGPGWGPGGWGGSVLVYATGGFAYAGVREGFVSTTPIVGPFALTSATIGNNGRTGFAAGGGIEWKFLPNWSIKGEYQFIGLRQGPVASATEFFFGLGTPFVVTHRAASIGMHTARIGLNYHFTLAPAAPVVARY
jgi:outer membrane immunogenic protein